MNEDLLERGAVAADALEVDGLLGVSAAIAELIRRDVIPRGVRLVAPQEDGAISCVELNIQAQMMERYGGSYSTGAGTGRIQPIRTGWEVTAVCAIDEHARLNEAFSTGQTVQLRYEAYVVETMVTDFRLEMGRKDEPEVFITGMTDQLPTEQSWEFQRA